MPALSKEHAHSVRNVCKSNGSDLLLIFFMKLQFVFPVAVLADLRDGELIHVLPHHSACGLIEKQSYVFA